jgi:phospholipid/cholesterol/gamma-HCH transport system ATP-binding protein
MDNKKDKDRKQTVMEIQGLKLSFNDFHVLNKLDFELYQGENLVIIGKSGTGKSVLIKCLVRLIEPDAGTIRVLGSEINRLNRRQLTDYRKKVGFLFQGGALYDSMTVRQNLLFPLERSQKNLSRAKREERIMEVLASVNLEHAVDKWPSELSGGMKKRIALARTLVLRPEIILYDEPTSGLDAVTSKEISNLIVETQKKFNTSSIIITHDINCARITANRISILKEGNFKQEGTYEELRQIEDPWITAFFE